LINSNFPK